MSLVSISIECSCMAPRTLVVTVMRGLVFHPLFWIAFISVFMCEGLLWKFVMAVCESYGLNYSRGGIVILVVVCDLGHRLCIK